MHWYHEQRCFKDSQLPLERHVARARPDKAGNVQKAIKWMRSEGRYAADGSMAFKRAPPKPWPPPPVSLYKLNNPQRPNRVLPFEEFTSVVADEPINKPQSTPQGQGRAQKERAKNPLEAKFKKLQQSQRGQIKHQVQDKQIHGLLRGMARVSQSKISTIPEYTRPGMKKTPVLQLVEDLKCEKRHVESILQDFCPPYFHEDGGGAVSIREGTDARPLLRRAFGQDMTEPEFQETWAALDPEKTGYVTFPRLVLWMLVNGCAPKEPTGREPKGGGKPKGAAKAKQKR